MEKKIVVNDENIKEIVRSEIWRLGNKADLNHIDVSGVTNMNSLFVYSQFNGDISQWDVSNVKYMDFMFSNSKFNQDISNWNVGNVESMWSMFSFSKFNQDISSWDVGKDRKSTRLNSSHVRISYAVFCLKKKKKKKKIYR